MTPESENTSEKSLIDIPVQVAHQSKSLINCKRHIQRTPKLSGSGIIKPTKNKQRNLSVIYWNFSEIEDSFSKS